IRKKGKLKDREPGLEFIQLQQVAGIHPTSAAMVTEKANGPDIIEASIVAAQKPALDVEVDADPDEPDFLRNLSLRFKKPASSGPPLPPPRPPTILPSSQTRPPLFDLAALNNLGKSLFALLTDPSARPTLPVSLDIHSLMSTLVTTIATTATLSNDSIPQVTSAQADGIRVTVKVDITNPTP
ncbi:hypothetical protein HDU76_011702, partial [Blyttiomyces sp. JEL0837]